ncbi:unnamed protein product [Adineta steineri]|uniref:b(0,+)-type amino acid transporter 1 n=2 Tax=Adineta steineri TaxID=433720 RepID=A0A819IQY8_9BILA|nr:unnamed protein product [Adineta steineri]
MRRNRLGQITTRLYIVLLIIGHVILILHTIIQPQILTKIFDQPSLTTYDRLMVDHSDTLQCPCSSISSIYNRYITIEPVFHQVCSSPFSSDHWRENVTAELAPNVSVYDARDYRLFLSAHLQCLTGLCNLSMQSVNDSIGQLLSSLYITTQLQSPTAFQTHIDSVVQQNFLTNASLALTEPVTYDNDCSCAFYANCTTQAGFFETNSSEIIAIKGLKIGCTPSESFLSSTLECFYDSSCINLIETKIKNTTIMNTTYVTELLYANSSRFLPNTTIIDLVNELFIETWLTTMNYSAYFDYCSPTYCSYTYIQQLSSLYTVTLLLGLYGGLSVVLKWICPKIVYILFKIYQYRKKQSNRVTFAHTTEAVVIETDITANTSINHQNTTVHSESESTVSTPETISYLVLLRSMFIGFLVLMLVAVALIGPFVYFSRHGKNQATEIISPNSVTTSSITTTNTTSTIILTSTVPSCQLTFQFVLSFPTGYIYSPKSFAVDDFNSDSHLDLAIPDTYASSVNIYLGNGDGTFRSANTFSTGAGGYPRTVAVGDFNNDNHVDLAVANYYGDNIGVLFGNNDGSFQEQMAIPTEYNSSPYVVIASNFNNDNQLDLAFVYFHGSKIGILLGEGNGAFRIILTSLIGSPSQAQSAAAADFNGDGHQDLVIDAYKNAVNVLFGNGDGTFSAQVILSTGQFSAPAWVATGDFNGDNRPDIAIVNSNDFNVGIMLANGNGTFAEQTTYSTGGSSHPESVVIGDFNNDHQLDLAIANSYTHNVGVMVGTGTGSFLRQMTFSVGPRSTPQSVAIGDFNNDNKLDIVFYDASNNTNNRVTPIVSPSSSIADTDSIHHRHVHSPTTEHRRVSIASITHPDPLGPITPTDDVTLKRHLGLFSGVCFIIGTIIGSGIFVSPKGVLRETQSVGLCLIIWMACGLVSLLGALCYAEIGTIIPRNGAEVAYLKEGIGSVHARTGDVLAYLFSWSVTFVMKPSSIAVLSLTFSQYFLSGVMDDCGPPEELVKMLAIFAILMLININSISVSAANRLNIIFVICKVSTVAIVIIAGLVRIGQGHTQNLQNGFVGTTNKPLGVALAFYSGLWAYDGWNSLNSVTEELKNPKRNLWLSIVLALPSVMILYLLTNISYFTVMNKAALLSSNAVAVTWGEAVLGPAVRILPILISISALGSANGSLFGAARYCMVSAQYGYLPEVFACIHARRLTPVSGVVLQGTIAIAFCLPSNVDGLIDFFSFAAWMFYALTFTATLCCKFTKKSADRVISVPIPLLVIIILISIYLVIAPLISSPSIGFLVAGILILFGLVFYYPFVYRKIELQFIKKANNFLITFFGLQRAQVKI